MTARNHHRAAGLGSVQMKTRARPRFWVYAPQAKGEPMRLIAKCETAYHAEKALLAWYVVRAVEMMAEMGGTCVTRVAS